jgi:hypothetical protein
MSTPSHISTVLNGDPLFFSFCIHRALESHLCKTRLTWEHAFTHAGKQINEFWAIVPTCEECNNDAHGKTKRFNQFVALWRFFEFSTLSAIYRFHQIEKYKLFEFSQRYSALYDEFGYVVEGVNILKIAINRELIYIKDHLDGR